jgi:hypothetical protein
MEFTRVDPARLAAQVREAEVLLAQAEAGLGALLTTLTDEERANVLRPSARFPDAGRELARIAAERPDLAQRADFDGAAVIEDLDNAGALAPLAARLARLTRLVDDSRALWLAEAYVPSLSLYRVTRSADGERVAPMEEIFAARRRR